MKTFGPCWLADCVATLRRSWATFAAMLFAWAAIASPCAAQLCVQLNGATHIQDFNTLAQTGTSNNASTLPIGFAFSESGTGNNITYAAGNGSSSTANTYSFGTTGSSDRALGEVTGGLQSILGACFVNNTGFVISSFSISYTGEQWRLGATAIQDKLDFQFSTTATALNTGTYTDVNSLDFSSPINSGSVGALDGNAAANRVSFGPIAIIPADTLAFGETFFIRWVPLNIGEANDGLAIDDFKITYQMSADFDLDQDVDGKDFLALQRGLGTKSGASVSIGDANKDGAVDLIDKLLWEIQFGTTRDAPPQFQSVPEPSGIWLAASLATILVAPGGRDARGRGAEVTAARQLARLRRPR